METFPVRRTTSVPLRHNLTDTEISSVDRDMKSSPLVGRKDSLHNQFSGTNIPMSDPVARTVSRSSYQLSNYRMAAQRPAETVLPYLSRDRDNTLTPLQKPQIRNPLLANKLPAFRRPHSNPNLPTEKRTYSSDVIGTKNPELEPSDRELTGQSKSAQNVQIFPSAPTAHILPISTGIHGYRTLTSTPNNENRIIINNNISAQEMATPILPRSADRVLEPTVNKQRSNHREYQSEPVEEIKPNYLRLIQNFLASKQSNFENQDNTTLQTNSFSNSELAQLVNSDVLSNVNSLTELGVELANQIRSSSSENLSRNSSGKSASVVTIESVLEALRYDPNHKQLTSNRSLNDLRTSHETPPDLRYKSAPSINVSHATRDTNTDITTRIDSTRVSKEESLEILLDHPLETKDEPIGMNGMTGDLLSQSDEKKHSSLFQTPNLLSTSSSVSFIHLNAQISQENQDNTERIGINKQTNELILSTKQPDPVITPLIPTNNTTHLFPDFITPTNPFETSTTFLTDIDTYQSVASVQPHTVDFDTMVEQGDTAIQPFSDNYQVDVVPSHYTVDVSKLDGEEDTFLPLTPSEIKRYEDNTISRQLEIVSLPQSSVASPSKHLQDNSRDDNPDRTDGVKFDFQQETSFEYINRFIAEVKKFMETRNIQTPSVISVEEGVVSVPPCDTIITPQLPSNMEEMITEIARQKIDQLWEDYLENKSCFFNKPQLIRRHDKIDSTADSTLSGYNTRLTSSLSDTTLFSSLTCHKSVRKNHLVLKPRRKVAQRRNKEVTPHVADLGAQTRSADLGVQTRSADLETQTRSADLGTQTRSADLGVQTRSADLGVQTRSADLETQTRSADLGVQTRSADLETQTRSADLETQTRSADLGVQTRSADLGVQTRSADLGAQTRSADLETQTRSADLGAQTRSADLGAQARSADLETQTRSADPETEQIPEELLLSVKVNSVAFLVTNDTQKPQDSVTHTTCKNLSTSMSLTEACQSFNPDFITNSCLRQIRIQQQRMSRREIAQQLLLVPTANKSVQTHLHTQDKQAGTFVSFKKKLTREEIQTQNKRWRRKFPDLRRRDLAKEQRMRGQLMRMRVKTYQKEILDPVRKSLPLFYHLY